MNTIKTILLISLIFTGLNCYSQRYNVNYEESLIPHYNLPKILESQGGAMINNTKDWEEFRRPEILNSFTNHIYGIAPGELDFMEVEVIEENEIALNGEAKRKQVTLTFIKDDKQVSADLLIYLPISSKKVPVFLGYNFYGNHTLSDDPNVLVTKSWVPLRPDINLTTNVADESSRGVSESAWPISKIIEAGYGLVTLYRGDIAPDKNEFDEGVYTLFYKNNQDKPDSKEWGTIAAWSWGLSRVMDYLETDNDIAEEKVIVIGHSRLGKTALWTAAKDERFAACISNNSGCMGAALSRRDYGETVEVVNTAFPHWFSGEFKKYTNKEYLLPIDQHMLISLIAPRPVYVASATEDRWADPRGEFLSAKAASVAYNLYNIQGLSSTIMPEPDSPIIQEVSYHIRTGKHGITDYDWDQYIEFAKYNNF